MLAKRLFQVVERQPEAIAIADPIRGDISYLQLWNYLKATSSNIDELFKDDKYIGIVADQDAYAVISCIAIMLSGKTIIPIDPRYEVDSIEQILQPFTDKAICETNKDLDASIMQFSLQDIVTNSNKEYKFKNKDANAYILHTSGTTGKPKPVLADQAALAKVAESLRNRYYIDSNSKVLQFAYLSFDSSLIEIWSTLFGGGTIVIAGKNIREDLYGCIEKLLSSNQITTVTLPPSVANNISDKCLHNLDTLILAGEECPTELVNRFYKCIPHLINAYGPTESIICSSTYEICKKQDNRIPIGKPLSGMRIVIDNPDENGQGEMLLVSSYLAKGYAKNNKKTKEKFIKTDSGERCYKSGDIGRVCDDGNYEFIGRVDNQIKINGQRIELEGIEAQIRNIMQSGHSAVVAVSGKLYCLYFSDSDIDIDDIIARLKDQLPAYAVPNQFIAIKEMPLDFNGKVNRKMLISIVENNKNKLAKEVNNQSNSVSTGMIDIWARLLETVRDNIEESSSFFSLGGDSLGALKLVKAINDHYDVNLRLSEVIADPATPESMLAAVERHKSGE